MKRLKFNRERRLIHRKEYNLGHDYDDVSRFYGAHLYEKSYKIDGHQSFFLNKRDIMVGKQDLKLKVP